MTQAHIEPATLTFGLGKYETFYAEAKHLFDLHHDELAKNKEVMRLAPDFEFYKRVNGVGRLIIVEARARGALVGYFLWVVSDYVHYDGVVAAISDIHFLLKKYRRGFNGYNLIEAAVGFARSFGVDSLTMKERVGHEHPALMKRLGFTPHEIVYVKIADRAGEKNG